MKKKFTRSHINEQSETTELSGGLDLTDDEFQKVRSEAKQRGLDEVVPAAGLGQVGQFLNQFLGGEMVGPDDLEDASATKAVPSSANALFELLRKPSSTTRDMPSMSSTRLDSDAASTSSVRSQLTDGSRDPVAVARQLAAALELASETPGMHDAMMAMVSNPAKASSLLSSFTFEPTVGTTSCSQSERCLTPSSVVKNAADDVKSAPGADDDLQSKLDVIKDSIQQAVKVKMEKLPQPIAAADPQAEAQGQHQAEGDGPNDEVDDSKSAEAHTAKTDEDDKSKVPVSQALWNTIISQAENLARCVSKADAIEKACQSSTSDWDFAQGDIRRAQPVLKQVREFNDKHKDEWLVKNYHTAIEGMSEIAAQNYLNVYCTKLKAVTSQIDNLLKPIIGTFDLRDKLRRKREVSKETPPKRVVPKEKAKQCKTSTA